jgi:hypothetical protein
MPSNGSPGNEDAFVPELRVLEDSEEVYRALRPSWIDKDTQQVLAPAFQRREQPQDESGLSVGIAQAWNLDEYATTALKNCKAVVALGVGPVRQIVVVPRLDIVPDSVDHANIKNIPRVSEDKHRAEDIASALVELAVCCWRRPDKSR